MNEAALLREDEGLVLAYAELFLGGMDEAEIEALWGELVEKRGEEFAGRVEAEVLRRAAAEAAREQSSNKSDASCELGGGSAQANPAAVPGQMEEVSVPSAAPPAPVVGDALEDTLKWQAEQPQEEADLPSERANMGAKADAEAEPKAEKTEAKEPAVLSANAPFDMARVFAERCCRESGVPVVWFWQGQFWRWNGKFYAPEPDEVMRGKVYGFLDGASRWVGNQLVRFQPTPRHVNEVLDCLKTGLARGVECQPPMWLSTQEPATEWIVFQNGIVNVLTGEVRELTPDFWAHSALAFDWDLDAKCPTWDQFSEDVFPGDEESKEFLEGLLHDGGDPIPERGNADRAQAQRQRNHQSRIASDGRRRILCRAQLQHMASGENSKECLIGRRVGVFADVRFKPGRAYGASFDPGGIGHVSTELLLNIIGEDTVSVGRKYKSPWHGQLRLKLILISNEVPNLNDPGGVLPSRFVKVRFGISFFGREDVTLRDKLSAELSGIAARCVKAYQRLCERGRFVQPRSADALERDVLAASDPFTAMALECFEPDPAGEVVKIVAYGRFERWCRDTGRIDVLRTTPANRFGGRLRAVAGFEHLGEYRPGGNKSRVWTGITVKST
jgi:putative DNA primase/helicase